MKNPLWFIKCVTCSKTQFSIVYLIIESGFHFAWLFPLFLKYFVALHVEPLIFITKLYKVVIKKLIIKSLKQKCQWTQTMQFFINGIPSTKTFDTKVWMITYIFVFSFYISYTCVARQTKDNSRAGILESECCMFDW